MCFTYKWLLLFAVIGCWSLPALADLTLAPPFTDNMVLQREMPVLVWGSGEPGSEVTVRFDERRQTTVVAENGDWQLKLNPLKASIEPRELEVSSGDQTLALSNVLVGEVWLFSGQSNMAMSVKGSQRAEKAIAAADLPKIRFYVSPPHPNRKPPRWQVTSPDNAGGFSAVSFYFARALRRDTDVPVGMIVCAKGGTMLQTWVRHRSLAEHPRFKEEILKAWERTARPEYLSKLMEKDWDQALEKAGGDEQRAVENIMGPAGQKPSINFQRSGMARIAPYTLRGFGWYQGESNAWGFDIAGRYREELELLITDWRTLWGEEKPFLIVQLPHYPQKKRHETASQINPWCIVMEAQWEIQNVLPKLYTAVTSDLGQVGDIHPDNKAPVGERLSLLVRRYVHGENIVARGPVFESMNVEEGRAELSFEHVNGGLGAREVPPTPAAADRLEGFLVAGEDRHFVRADSNLEGVRVTCEAEEVDRPAAVRYAMHENCIFNLYNGAGLPAAPFRTDDWPVDTPPRKEPRAVALPRTEPITIDGKLDEAAWEKAQSINDLELFHTYHKAENQTEARFAWDDDALYAAFTCHQPMDAVRAKAAKRDNAEIWSDDNVQLFLDVNHDRRTYVRIAVNPDGVVADGAGFNDWRAEGRLRHQGLLVYYRDFQLKDTIDCEVATARGTDAWTVEMAIAWGSLGLKEGLGAQAAMGLQLTRTYAASDERSEWATTGRDYNTGAMLPYSYLKGQRLHHGVGRFGTLRLEGE